MAGDLLANKDAVHIPRFDLESLFYVFIYQCCMCVGPKGDMKDESNAPDFLHTWLHPEIQKSEQDQGMIKKGMLDSSKELYHNLVTKHFTPYMRVFSECVVNIQQLFRFREQVEVTHSAMIKELQAAKRFIPSERVMQPREIPKRIGTLRSRKWSRIGSGGLTSGSPPPPYIFSDSDVLASQAAFYKNLPSGAKGIGAGNSVDRCGADKEEAVAGEQHVSKSAQSALESPKSRSKAEVLDLVSGGHVSNYITDDKATPYLSQEASAHLNSEENMPTSTPTSSRSNDIRAKREAGGSTEMTRREVKSVESFTFESKLDGQASTIIKKVVKTTTTTETVTSLTSTTPMQSAVSDSNYSERPSRIPKRRSPRSSSASHGIQDIQKNRTAKPGANEGTRLPRSSSKPR